MVEQFDEIDLGREAVAREAWQDAYERLVAVDPSELSASDLENLADAAWWLSKHDESIAARQKAYSGYASAGEDRAAAFVAARLCIDHALAGEPATGSGWMMRAQRHLDEQPDCIEAGFVLVIQANLMRFSGDHDGSLTLARRAVQLGRRFGDADLVAMAMHTEGLTLVAAGDVPEGMSLLDEVMTSVLTGELSTYYTGVIYCNVLEACLNIADVRRAGEWSRASLEWSTSLPPSSPYPGVCRVNRAEVRGLSGDWARAESEAAQAALDLETIDPIAAAGASYEVGEIRRRTGKLASADDAFNRAHRFGLEPQPGLAMLRLAQGNGEAARTGLRLALSEDDANAYRRARLLAAQVEIELAAGSIETARSANQELEQIARDFATPMLSAVAETARGRLGLASANATDALEHLRRACTHWRDLKIPYEHARARVLLGVALRAADAEEDALLELRAARSAFEQLGASPEAASTAELLGETPELPNRLTPREAEVLRLVAAGDSNREIASILVISEHTVARHLQNMFTKLGVSSRSAATAFAFEHGLA